ncbi:MAG: hypothetical protein IPL39_15070 [Opitutaceae bacterium]|nr:hypothetical protein [Opitutaceae bacterium]
MALSGTASAGFEDGTNSPVPLVDPVREFDEPEEAPRLTREEILETALRVALCGRGPVQIGRRLIVLASILGLEPGGPSKQAVAGECSAAAICMLKERVSEELKEELDTLLHATRR